MTLTEALQVSSVLSQPPEGCTDKMLLLVFQWRKESFNRYESLCRAAGHIGHPVQQDGTQANGASGQIIRVLQDGTLHNLAVELPIPSNAIRAAISRLRDKGLDITTIEKRGACWYRLEKHRESAVQRA